MRAAEIEEAVKWIETVTLPEAPESWEGVEDDPSMSINGGDRLYPTAYISRLGEPAADGEAPPQNPEM